MDLVEQVTAKYGVKATTAERKVIAARAVLAKRQEQDTDDAVLGVVHGWARGQPSAASSPPRRRPARPRRPRSTPLGRNCRRRCTSS